jgi:hypothetical protein
MSATATKGFAGRPQKIGEQDDDGGALIKELSEVGSFLASEAACSIAKCTNSFVS